MKNKCINLILLFLFISLITITVVVCAMNRESSLPDKEIILPYDVADTTSYVFVHIVRDQKCTECEVNALYQWDNVVSMIGRNDILFLFVIEMHPNDTPDIIAKALSRRPFHQVLYIDYAKDFLNNNSWLQNRQYKEYNNFLLNNSGRVIAIGDPLNDLQFMKYMKNL